MEFSRTALGQLAIIGFIIYLVYTGIAFRILNLLFILWWLTPFLLVPFTRYFNKKVGMPTVNTVAGVDQGLLSFWQCGSFCLPNGLYHQLSILEYPDLPVRQTI